MPQGLETILFEPEISSTFIVLQVVPLSLDYRTSSGRGCLLALPALERLLVSGLQATGYLALKEEPLPEAHPGLGWWGVLRAQEGRAVLSVMLGCTEVMH